MADPSNQDFLVAMFKEMPPSVAHAHVCSILKDPKLVETERDKYRWKGQYWFVNGDPLEPEPWTGRFGPKANNYVAVASFVGPSRSVRDVLGVHALMVDDVGPKLPLSILDVAPPSVVVETSPGNCQAWYFLHWPEPDPSRFGRFTSRFWRKYTTTDPGMEGAARYGRLPVGSNTKTEYVTPFLQRIHQWDLNLTHSLDELADAFGVDMAAPDPVRPQRFSDASYALIPEVLEAWGFVQKKMPSGWWVLKECPFGPHESRQDGAGYMPPSEHYPQGAFKCHHSHRPIPTTDDLWRWVQENNK